jgi:hypothetical protein
MSKVGEEIELSMKKKKKNISQEERQNIWKPKFFKMYLQGVT